MDPRKHPADLVSLPTSWQQKDNFSFLFLFHHSHVGLRSLTKSHDVGTSIGLHDGAALSGMRTLERWMRVGIGSAWTINAHSQDTGNGV